MIKLHTYKSSFFDKTNLELIEPFYIVHKAQNKQDANFNAKWYFENYWYQKQQPQKKAALLKKLLITNRRLKKL